MNVICHQPAPVATHFRSVQYERLRARKLFSVVGIFTRVPHHRARTLEGTSSPWGAFGAREITPREGVSLPNQLTSGDVASESFLRLVI